MKWLKRSLEVLTAVSFGVAAFVPGLVRFYWQGVVIVQISCKDCSDKKLGCSGIVAAVLANVLH